MKRSTDAERRERDSRSISVLRDLLRNVIADPSTYRSDAGLIKALGSQGALAKYEDATRGIVGMSLNTQKLVAEKDFGYDILDRLRRGAAESIATDKAKSAASNKTTKLGLTRRVLDLEREVQMLESDLGQMTYALARIISVGRSMAEAVGTADAMTRWRKELRSIEGGLSLRKKPMPAKNVLSFNASHAPE